MTMRLGSLLCVAVLATACSDDANADGMACTLNAVVGLEVTVRGAGNADGSVIGVTITDGDYVEELDCGSDGYSLVCRGAVERAGTYKVEVIAGGDVAITEQVTVADGECHVVPKKITL